MSMDAGVDAAIYCRELFAEILIKDYVPSQCGRLLADIFPVIAATDCRSLYDLLVKDGPLPSTQEKCFAIDIGGLKETAGEFDEDQERLNEIFSWIATEVQRADHLTKLKPAFMLRDIFSKGRLALRVDSTDDHQTQWSSRILRYRESCHACIDLSPVAIQGP